LADHVTSGLFALLSWEENICWFIDQLIKFGMYTQVQAQPGVAITALPDEIP
jgi:hypothetical protein